MSDRISVNINELKKQEGRMKKNVDACLVQIKKLEDECISNVTNYWKSSENTEYIAKIKDYIEDIKKLQSSLDSYVYILHLAADKYESAQKEAAQVAGGKE